MRRACRDCPAPLGPNRQVCDACRIRIDRERYAARVARRPQRKQHVVLGRSGTAIERFMVKVHIDDLGCWRWRGALNGTGYAQFRSDGEVRAGRWAYKYFRGPIPDGLQLDHLCSQRDCVNPEHLEPVTAKENTRRALARRSAA